MPERMAGAGGRGPVLRNHKAAKHRHRLAALRMRRFAGDSEPVSPSEGHPICALAVCRVACRLPERFGYTT